MQELPAVMEPIESRSATELEEVVLPASAAPSEPASGSRGGYGWWLLGTVAALAAAIATVTITRGKGSAQEGPAATHRDNGPATIRVVKSKLRDMISPVGQPGFVEAYEQTALFSKVSGFIKKFSVDIGDEVKQNQVLCEIIVPELEQEFQQKVAQLELDVNMVKQAEQLEEVARTKIKTALAEQREAEADVGKYRAEVVRWGSELKRMTRMVADKVLDVQSLDETQKTFDSTTSALDAAKAAVAAREAAKLSAEAELAKATIDIKTANSKVKVSKAEERRLAALLDYTKITAPYDGVVTVRNANTGDFVESIAGDKMASGHVPIFVVARTDLARIFVDVPEESARYVHPGTKATVRSKALSGLEIPATVTRIAWSLNQKSRTMRAEIDLPAEQSGVRPGMYVYASVLAERPNVRAVPREGLVVLGNETYAYLLNNGRAVKTPVEPGISDEKLTEIVQMKTGESWHAVTGDEQFIVGDLADMIDGQTVVAARVEGE
jgi:RND family efflux transporter MFP subunit